MKKQLFVLALAAAVLFTACGQRADTIKADYNQEMVKESEQLETEQKEKFPEAESSEIPGALEAEIPDREIDSDFSKGIVSESGWESQWLGMRFVAPEGTRMASEEALAELMGISEELLEEDLSEAQMKYAELTSVREMMCYDESTKTNMIVSVDRLPFKMSEEAYAEQLAPALSAVSAMKYEKAGEDEQVEIAGIPYLRSRYQVEAMGQSVHTDYYIRMIDSRVVYVIVTYGKDGEELASSMVSGFAAY